MNILTKRNIITLIVICILIIAIFLLSLNTGTLHIAPLDVLQTLIGQGTHQQELILFDFRMPRMIVAILVGAGLALSGAILQAISRNGIADPGIIGINTGAGLGVIVFVSFLYGKMPVDSFFSVFVLPLFALVGALAAAVIIYVLAWKQGVTPIRLILVGIAVNAGFGALLLILSLKMSPNNFQFATIWLAGSLWGTDWKFVLAALPWMLILLPLAIYKARFLNALNLGDPISTGLGIHVERERAKLLFISVALAGTCVAVAGGIGFIGLIAPHIARKLVGPKHQILLPTAALIGSFLVLASDLLSRSLLTTTEIPVGVIISALGAPYFIYLLMKTK
ncbi:FecCD family ABC transporter permease [Priestia taiwanensis]|uniref:Iron ABC transporter permease n=1 Tax=Priestia taiwanensis TaxID=1347902 RepID=A0A917EUG3_9BACI|nr:iron ABC transporter permease [Priestia taiwanensis]MBM7365279.1 iron complex transport system permease protein [Priestia taiwanensis]GGE85887.1 iron ABC transporter permease [Priestia taiwanensis]